MPDGNGWPRWKLLQCRRSSESIYWVYPFSRCLFASQTYRKGLIVSGFFGFSETGKHVPGIYESTNEKAKGVSGSFFKNEILNRDRIFLIVCPKKEFFSWKIEKKSKQVGWNQQHEQHWVEIVLEAAARSIGWKQIDQRPEQPVFIVQLKSSKWQKNKKEKEGCYFHQNEKKKYMMRFSGPYDLPSIHFGFQFFVSLWVCTYTWFQFTGGTIILKGIQKIVLFLA